MAFRNQLRTWRNSARLKPKTHLFVVFFVSVVVVLATLLSCFLFYVYFQKILETLAISESLSPETDMIINELFFDLLWVIGVVESAILFAVALVSLNFVFKVTGAEYAVSRHIREKMLNGKWEPLQLRKGDALISVAEQLNKLSEKQAARNQGAS